MYIICPIKSTLPPKKPYIQWTRYDRTLSFCAGNIGGTTTTNQESSNKKAKKSEDVPKHPEQIKQIKEIIDFLKDLVKTEEEIIKQIQSKGELTEDGMSEISEKQEKIAYINQFIANKQLLKASDIKNQKPIGNFLKNYLKKLMIGRSSNIYIMTLNVF